MANHQETYPVTSTSFLYISLDAITQKANQYDQDFWQNQLSMRRLYSSHTQSCVSSFAMQCCRGARRIFPEHGFSRSTTQRPGHFESAVGAIISATAIFQGAGYQQLRL